MNGRIYDPGLGRFLQADPLIQDLSNPQSLNRYTYVFNNPLAYTDPTGYSAFSNYLRPILAIGAAYFTAGWSTSLFAAGNTAAALAVSIGGGALTGAIATGSGKGALIGAFTGAAAFGVGSSIAGGNSAGITNNAMRNGAEMLVGGFQNLVNHGEFGFTAMVSVSAEYGVDSPQTQSRERSQNLIDLNARDTTPEDYASVMGAPENWLAYESSPGFRAAVPGQVLFDNAVTAAEDGAYGKAALYAGAMLSEQILTVATLGYGTPASQSIRSLSSGSVGRFFGPQGPVFGHPAFGGATPALYRTGQRFRMGFGQHNGAQFRIVIFNKKFDIGRPIKYRGGN